MTYIWSLIYKKNFSLQYCVLFSFSFGYLFKWENYEGALCSANKNLFPGNNYKSVLSNKFGWMYFIRILIEGALCKIYDYCIIGRIKIKICKYS